MGELGEVGSSKRVFTAELVENGVPFYRGTEIGALAENKLIKRSLFISEEHYQELINDSGYPSIGDLLMPSICPDGRVWMVDTLEPFYFKDGRVLWVHFDSGQFDKKYIHLALKTMLIKTFGDIASGSTFAELKIFILKDIEIPLPPLVEQQRIVAAIESVFAVIDEIERNKTDLQTAVTAAKSKILSLAIRGMLVPQDPNDEPASALLERIRTERETLIKAGKIKRGKSETAAVRSCDNSYYDGIPDSWMLRTLGDIGNTNIGLTYKPTDICVDGVPVLRSNNIKDGILDYADLIRVNTVFNNSLELSVGDILICARNGSRHLVGKCALITKITERMTFGAFMAVYRSECSHFIYHFMNSHFFRRIFESEGISTQINQLTQAMIKETVIPLPPIAEQRRIVIAIEAAFEQLDSIAAILA